MWQMKVITSSGANIVHYPTAIKIKKRETYSPSYFIDTLYCRLNHFLNINPIFRLLLYMVLNFKHPIPSLLFYFILLLKMWYMKKIFLPLVIVTIVSLTSQAQTTGMGIGTTNPNEKLDVAGAIKIGNTINSNDGTIRWTGSDFEGRKSGVWVSLTAGGGSGLTGSGTTNYITKWTGATSLGNSVLYDNGTNIGIGTNNPQQLLHLYGTSGVDGIMFPDGTVQTSAATGGIPNTLDQAYDQGGPGAGRIIDATDGAVRINGDDGFIITGTYSSGDAIEVSGAGTRMFFNPQTAAFRSGYVNGTQWDAANIGSYSIATGYNTTASGTHSVAMGDGTQASGNFSFASGKSSVANGISSTALGQGSIADGDYSLASGHNTTASGIQSLALGRSDTASGSTSIAIGDGNHASGNNGSIAMGFRSKATGGSSIALGFESFSTSGVAMGSQTLSSGSHAVAIGYRSTASGISSFAVGPDAMASGVESSAIGGNTTASGLNSMVIGYNSTASGNYSVALGNEAIASGTSSAAIGHHSKASGDFSGSLGFFPEASGYASIALGYSTTASGGSSTSMGVNTEASGSSSTAMGNNTEAIGENAVSMGYNTEASGKTSLAVGESTEAKSYLETVIGIQNTDYTPISTTTWSGTDRLFVVANGWNLVSGSNALTILKNGNTGFGGDNPQSRVQVTDGDVYIDNSSRGVIMKSPDGNCWRMTVDNSGSPVFTGISCP